MQNQRAISLMLLIFSLPFATSCNKDEPGVRPSAPTNLTINTLDDTSIDLVWKDNSPNESGFKIEQKEGVSDYVLLASVSPNVTLYKVSGLSMCKNQTFRILAYNNAGASLSASNEATRVGQGVEDKNGNCYQTVQIGTQRWMGQNLRTTKYSNGNDIANVTALPDWSSLTSGAWSHYNNNSQFEIPYGKLYNWYAVSDPRKLCPTGWRMPNESDFTILTTYLGGESVAGGKLKEVGTEHWNTPNTAATNETKFTAIPGGYRAYDVNFSHMGIGGYIWSADEFDSNNAWVHGATHDTPNLFSYNNGIKTNGFSVRCIKEQP